MKGKKTPGKRKPSPRRGWPKHLPHIHLNAAGVDVGSRSHFVAVPEGRDTVSVREYGTFTTDLEALADWLKQCGVDTVAMESTGVYWIPLYELLEARGFEVRLVDARRVKNVPGRKTDVLDCQWLQQLHTYGLLGGAFRPPEAICALRAYARQRETLVRYAASHIQHIQKALQQMNLLLHNVVSDVTGVTGMQILKAILSGERDPHVLAKFRDRRCAQSEETIAKSLVGTYREEHLFTLKQAVELYEIYQERIAACDRKTEQHLASLEAKVDLTTTPVPKPTKPARMTTGNRPQFDLHSHLYRITGVDLSRISGVDVHTGFKVIAETGTDMSPFPTEKHFTSWLGLAPGNKISGGKRLSGKTKPCANRAAATLRLAANGLHHAKSALGAYFRRQKARLGSPKAITATARKLACLIYRMLKYGMEFVEQGQDYYERQYQERTIKGMRKKAHTLGFELVKIAPAPL
jgi:transposase